MEKLLPYFIDQNDNTWELLSINVCIDFGGRQAQMEFQRNNEDGTYPTKTFVYYYNSDEFVQWDREEVEDITVDMDTYRETKLYRAIIPLFSEFGEPWKGDK